MVVFAHGSGSGRLSPRNNYVANALREGGLATLLFDLLTQEESTDRENVFDIELLANRLLMAREWVKPRCRDERPTDRLFRCQHRSCGGAGGGRHVAGGTAAVVSRGGRPDTAGAVLTQVCAPTLLIVGGRDFQVLELNRSALAQLRYEEKELQIVPGASHLFEEPGILDAVIDLAREWFADHFVR